MKTLFITDLDGTLLRSDKTVSKEAAEIINRLIADGVAFSYATARSIYSSSVLTNNVNFGMPVVTKNGAIIHNPDWSILKENAFTKEEAEEIKKKYRSLCAKDTYSDEIWLEVMPQLATKADAILQLKQLLGFERIVVFGDAVNDIPMFEVADECYAMENAVPELKAIATGIIGNNNENGVAEWLKENYRRYV